jgi:serine/threonine protein kinase
MSALAIETSSGLFIPPFVETDPNIDRLPPKSGEVITLESHDSSQDLTVVRRFLSGEFAEVCLVQDAEGTQRVLKITDPESEQQSDFEMAAHVGLNGEPYTIPILDLGLVRRNNGERRSILMPYFPEGDLYSHVKGRPLSLEKVQEFGQKVIAGAKAFEARGLVNRDIKTRNFLLEGDDCIMTDFGSTQVVGGEPASRFLSSILGFTHHDQETGGLRNTTIVTPGLSAPESYEGVPYTNKLDAFSAAIVIFQLATGGKSPYGLTGSITHGVYLDRARNGPTEIEEHIKDPRLAQLIRGGLAPDTLDRYDLSQMESDILSI